MEVKVINLDRRTDRWESIQQQLNGFGIHGFVRFPAYDGGKDGFNKSMFYALRGEGSLLLLEDDCIFDGTIDDLMKYAGQLPADYDLLYLGANVLTPQKQYSENLWHLDNAWTTHAILYSAKGRRWCADNFIYWRSTIYDEWLRTVAQKRLKCFICKPMLAFQSVGQSDITPQIADYHLKETEINLL